MARILSALLLVLFFSTLLAQPQGKGKKPKVPPTKQHGPRLYFPKIDQDAGNIPEGPEHLFWFPFQNRGDMPLIIYQIKASSPVFGPGYYKDPGIVMPGQWDTLYRFYTTNHRPGPFAKSLWVVCNDDSTDNGNLDRGVFGLYVKGVVVPDTTRR